MHHRLVTTLCFLPTLVVGRREGKYGLHGAFWNEFTPVTTIELPIMEFARNSFILLEL